MQKIEAQFEIVTPMFIGGANKEGAPEIRPPSIKGALRFWWRALQWGTCLKKEQNNPEAALRMLHKQEAELFGAAVNDESGGQGKVLLKLKNVSVTAKAVNNGRSGIKYLRGQGLSDASKQALINNHEEGLSFSIVLILDNTVNKQPLIDTLMLFGLLGGLGSRSRKGLGSVAIKYLNYTSQNKEEHPFPVPENEAQYIETIQELLHDLPEQFPPFTALSQQMRIDLSLRGGNSDVLLNQLGNEMLYYRSYGQENKATEKHEVKINGQAIDAKQHFKQDHNIVFDFGAGKSIHNHPKRVIFGLPHNYFFSSNKLKVDVNAEHYSRRTSPLYMHIHRFSSGQCIAVQSLLKAQFLPSQEKIKMDAKNRSREPKLISVEVDWKDITEYLDNSFSEIENIEGGSARKNKQTIYPKNNEAMV